MTLIKKLFLILTITWGLFGCTTRVGDLTLVSTKNIDLSNTQLDIKSGTRQTAEDCVFVLLSLIPLGLPNIENAMDQALEKGNGNIMVDEVTRRKETWVVLGTIACIEVEGTVLNTALISTMP
jgi:hypothetical protein